MHQEWLEAKPSDGMDILYTGAHRNLSMDGFNSLHWTAFFTSLNKYLWQRMQTSAKCSNDFTMQQGKEKSHTIAGSLSTLAQMRYNHSNHTFKIWRPSLSDQWSVIAMNCLMGPLASWLTLWHFMSGANLWWEADLGGTLWQDGPGLKSVQAIWQKDN